VAGEGAGSNAATRFRLDGRVAIITGGAGLLGRMHAEAVLEAGGIPVLWDIRGNAVAGAAADLIASHGGVALGQTVDITDQVSVGAALDQVVVRFGRVDVLINNAANDPKVKSGEDEAWMRFEHFPEAQWMQDIQVGLTGAFLCAQAVGTRLAAQSHGVIINVASDLGIIAPDQRLYEMPGLTRDRQPVKPVSYSVVKHGLIGLTKYLATYWADRQVRVNALAPGGVQTSQPQEFIDKVASRIPMGRMAWRNEYKGAIVFLASDASSYMTGATLIVDGGRTCW